MPSTPTRHAVLAPFGGRVSAVIMADPDGAATLVRLGVYDAEHLLPLGPDRDDVAPGWTWDGSTFTAPPPAPAPTPGDPDPTPSDPGEPGTPASPGGASSAEIAELRATTVAQQESIDWLTDVVTALVTGEEPSA